MPDTFEYDVFVSYSHYDKVWVRNVLTPRLTEAGLRVCIDCQDFHVGASAVKEMERAVLTSRKTLVILSPAFLASEWTEFEHVMLLALAPANRGERMIPLLKSPSDLPLRLRALLYVDFTDSDPTLHPWSRLLQALGPSGVSSSASGDQRTSEFFVGSRPRVKERLASYRVRFFLAALLVVVASCLATLFTEGALSERFRRKETHGPSVGEPPAPLPILPGRTPAREVESSGKVGHNEVTEGVTKEKAKGVAYRNSMQEDVGGADPKGSHSGGLIKPANAVVVGAQESEQAITGLRGQYFNLQPFLGGQSPNTDTVDLPNFSRIDRTIDFDWGRGAPALRISADYFFVRWTGEIFAPVDGVYRFRSEHDDGVRLLIDDAPVIDEWRTDYPEKARYVPHIVYVNSDDGTGYVFIPEGDIFLKGNAWHAIEIQYLEWLFEASVRIKWRPPGESALVTIPSQSLRPEATP